MYIRYCNIPSLPQLPPSSTLLKTLWPRLKTYAVLSEADPLYAPCAAGAGGDEAKAVECFAMWDRRVPQLLGKAEDIRRSIWRTFPNMGADGKPFSGSYWNEAGKCEGTVTDRTTLIRFDIDEEG